MDGMMIRCMRIFVGALLATLVLLLSSFLRTQLTAPSLPTPQASLPLCSALSSLKSALRS